MLRLFLYETSSCVILSTSVVRFACNSYRTWFLLIIFRLSPHSDEDWIVQLLRCWTYQRVSKYSLGLDFFRRAQYHRCTSDQGRTHPRALLGTSQPSGAESALAGPIWFFRDRKSYSSFSSLLNCRDDVSKYTDYMHQRWGSLRAFRLSAFRLCVVVRESTSWEVPER